MKGISNVSLEYLKEFNLIICIYILYLFSLSPIYTGRIRMYDQRTKLVKPEAKHDEARDALGLFIYLLLQRNTSVS